MHIAICDDNVADRHQSERLLKRESDKRVSTTGPLYIDSYGNANALLSNPMQYDIFYIDITRTEGMTGKEVVDRLTERGVHAPIVMCCSTDNYRSQEFPSNVIFLDKPIRTAELAESIDHAINIKRKAPSMIEIRTDGETLYLTENEVVYADTVDRFVQVTLSDGRVIQTYDSAESFHEQLERHPVFVMPNNKAVINVRYLKRLGLLHITMKDGTEIRLQPECRMKIKQIWAAFH